MAISKLVKNDWPYQMPCKWTSIRNKCPLSYNMLTKFGWWPNNTMEYWKTPTDHIKIHWIKYENIQNKNWIAKSESYVKKTNEIQVEMLKSNQSITSECYTIKCPSYLYRSRSWVQIMLLSQRIIFSDISRYHLVIAVVLRHGLGMYSSWRYNNTTRTLTQ